MGRHFPVYIKIDEDLHRIRTSSIPFVEFAEAMRLQDKNLLILSGAPLHCDYHRKTGLEYVTKENLPGLMTEEVDQVGDFIWLDFQGEEALNRVTEQELMEMLYLRHRFQPYNNFVFESIQNQYAYCSHDDGWLCWIYTKTPRDYKKVIAYDLQKKCKGRRRYLAPPDEDVLEQIYKFCCGGAVIDYAEMDEPGIVKIIPVGGEIYDLDILFETLDRYRRKATGLHLAYHARKKVWEAWQR